MWSMVKRRVVGLLSLLALAALGGCGGPPPESKDFDGSYDAGVLNIAYRGQAELRNCNASLVLYMEDGRSEVKRNWGVWKKDEVKRVEMPKGTGGFQWCEMNLTAKKGDKGEENFTARWVFPPTAPK